MYTRIFKDKIELSALGMGNMRLPMDTNGKIDYGRSKEMLDYAIAHGVNYFDTAYIYNNGESEQFLGQALAEYQRDSYFLADKFNLPANSDYRMQFEEQLKRLQTEYIDFYMLHGVQDNSIEDYLNCGAVEHFDSLKKEGKIKYFGVSVHCAPANYGRILNAYPWDFIQIQLNYYDWLYGDARALCEMTVAKGIAIMVMEPVRGGTLASLTPEGNEMLKQSEPDKSVASWALRWVADIPNVLVVLSGMSNLEQIKDNINTFEAHNSLTTEQEQLLMKACRLLRPTISVACTSCRYCCDACPKALDIPFLLSIYNDTQIGGMWRIAFAEGLSDEKKPSACIACGACIKHCPQGFDIPTYLKEMSEIARNMKV